MSPDDCAFLGGQAGWWPDRLYRLMTGYQASAILKTAIELDLFRALAAGPADAERLARSCEASPRGMRVLCDSLVVLGLLEKAGALYSPAPGSAAFLDSASPAWVGGSALFLLAPELVSRWDDLAAIVRHGGALDAGTISSNNPIWVRFARGMGPMRRTQAAALARWIVSGGPAGRVLDVAAGHGVFGIELARQAPEARVTALDWPDVLEVARENATAAGVAERFDLLPGDAREIDFGAGYDVVLLPNFLHHFDRPTCERLLRKTGAALRAGGRVVVVDFIPNDDRVSPAVAALCSVNMLVETPGGDAYTYAELEEMLRATGFVELTRASLEPTPHRALAGRTPADRR